MADPVPVKVYEDFDESADGKSNTTSTEQRWAVLYGDGVDTTAVVARRADGLPAIGSTHPDDTALTVKNRSARRMGKSSNGFLVRIFYKTTDFDSGGSEAVHPLSRPLKKSAQMATGSVEIDTFLDGNDEKPIVNFARQQLRAVIEHGDRVISLVWNVGTFRPKFYDTFGFQLNEGVFFEYPAGHALCLGINQEYTEEDFEGDTVVYWVNNSQFLVRLKRPTAAGDVATQGFKTRILNAGTLQLNDAGEQVPIVDIKTNQQITEQTPLTAEGKAILDTSGPYDPKWIEEEVYSKVDFENIGYND